MNLFLCFFSFTFSKFKSDIFNFYRAIVLVMVFFKPPDSFAVRHVLIGKSCHGFSRVPDNHLSNFGSCLFAFATSVTNSVLGPVKKGQKKLSWEKWNLVGILNLRYGTIFVHSLS